MKRLSKNISNILSGIEGVLVDIVHDEFGLLRPVVEPINNTRKLYFEAPSRMR